MTTLHPKNQVDELLGELVIHYRYVDGALCKAPHAMKLTPRPFKLTCLKCMREVLSITELYLREGKSFDGALNAEQIQILRVRRTMLRQKLGDV